MKRFYFLPLIAILALSGCGYTTKSLLSESIKTVYIPPVKNGIDMTAEVTDRNPFRPYRPGLEVDLTNALINRFIFDGTLKIATAENADLVVEASLVDYRRDALRYSEGDDIQEYRLSVSMDVHATERRTGKDRKSVV